MKKLKISIVEPVGGHGGNEFYDFNLIDSISDIKHEVILYTCDKTIQRKGVKLFYKKVFGNHNIILRGLRYVIGTIKSLFDSRIRKVDIVHLHFFGFTQMEYLNLILSKKIFRFKTIGTIHDIESFEKYAKGDTTKENYKKFISLLDGIVVHTEYAKSELIRHIGKNLIDINKIKTIYACDLDYKHLDNNYINEKKAKEKLLLPKDKKILLFFGQIKKVKGLDILLKSLQEVEKKHPDILLVIAGKIWKDEESGYQKIIDDYNIKKNVELRLEFIPNEEIPYYFNASTLIILPYRKIYNSGVLIRAMSFSKPIVASNFGPFREFIEDKKNGFLFERENVDDLSEKIIFALSSNVDLSLISLNIKKTIINKFDLSDIGSQYKNFYRRYYENKK